LNVVIHSIELCAGVGMLGEGVRAAFKHLGFAHRTICYVERETSAAGQLVALMEAGALDSAPVWSDLITFDGAAWRGLVDCVIAGFPCQDLSVAGKRAGLDGKRSGLFFNVADIADACGARFLILENVSGIASASASVVDETEGELCERAASRVLGELADRGWDAEWMHLRASDVGASHQRNRWFCLAWRNMVDAVRDGGDRSRDRESWCGWRVRKTGSSVVNAESQRNGSRGVSIGVGSEVAGATNSNAAVGDSRCERIGAHQPERFTECGCSSDIGSCGCELGDPKSNGRHQRRPESGGEQGRSDASEYGRSTNDLFAPGPLDDRWAGIVARYPWLAPATQFSICGMANGLAHWLDGDVNGENTETSERDQQSSYPQTSSAQRVDAWRKMLQVRLNEMLAEAPPRLFQANGCDDPLLEMSSRNGSCGRYGEPCSCGHVRDLRLQFSAEEAQAINDLFQFGVFGPDGQVERGKEMEGRNHRLRMCGNGVVPIQAAVAVVTLARRAGIFE
jgi:DNA (cytosine-5)-methyltransferase 1